MQVADFQRGRCLGQGLQVSLLQRATAKAVDHHPSGDGAEKIAWLAQLAGQARFALSQQQPQEGVLGEVGGIGTLEEILYGPAPVADGTANLIGALRKSMATTGYSDLKEFQRVEVVLAPYEA